MASSSKPRQTRLRASCDGCFHAKVKCSKERPMCTRCMSCGIHCVYSPSSRAGKPKSDGSKHNQHSTRIPDANSALSTVDNKTLLASAGQQVVSIPGWHTPPTSIDMGRSPSIASELALLGVDTSMASQQLDIIATTGEMYPSISPWTPPTDFSCAPYSDCQQAVPMMQGIGRSQSHDVAMSTAAFGSWHDPGTTDVFAYGQTHIPTPASMGSNYFPSPSTTPHLRPAPPRHKSASAASAASSGSCTCFTVCLQSLQALHNASSPASPPLDLVLQLNGKAVEGCAAMLACSRCMSRSGTHTAAMLLATVIGKITSFYKNATQSHFDSGGMSSPVSGTSPGLGVRLGAYQVDGEHGRALELHILGCELQKLKEVYARFSEVCGQLSEDAEMSKAMIGYLSQNLDTTLEVVSHNKGGVPFA